MKKDEMISEITEAIGGHSIWRTRLKTSIKLEERDLPVTDIERDDQCRFGKWLKALPSSVPCEAKFKEVRDCHAAFHATTGEVAQLVNEGKYDEAQAALKSGSFTQKTDALTLALNELRRCVNKS